MKEKLEQMIKELNKEVNKVERKYYNELRPVEKSKIYIELIKLNERQRLLAEIIKMTGEDNADKI